MIRYFIFVFFIITLSFESYCAISPATMASIAATSGGANNIYRSNEFCSQETSIKKFDYMITCNLTYTKISDGIFSYICPNPPKTDLIVNITVIFDSDRWPQRIIYFMNFNKE